MPVVWEVRGGQAAMGLQQRLFLFFLLFSARLKTLSVFVGKNTCAGRLRFIYPLGSSPKRLSLLQAGKGLCHSAPKPARSKYLPLFQAKGAFLTPRRARCVRFKPGQGAKSIGALPSLPPGQSKYTPAISWSCPKGHRRLAALAAILYALGHASLLLLRIAYA